MKKATQKVAFYIAGGSTKQVLLNVRENPKGIALTLSRDLLFYLEEG